MWLNSGCRGPGFLRTMKSGCVLGSWGLGGNSSCVLSSPAQRPPLGRSPAPRPLPTPALQLSVLLIWHLLPSNILYCSRERKRDVREREDLGTGSATSFVTLAKIQRL